MKINSPIYVVIALQVVIIILFFLPIHTMNMGVGRTMHESCDMKDSEKCHTMESMSDSEHDMHSTMSDMTVRMEGKTGDELDQIFLEDMIVHHEGAVAMAEILRDETERPELQKMADDIIAAQSSEIDMMKMWLGEWFGISN